MQIGAGEAGVWKTCEICIKSKDFTANASSNITFKVLLGIPVYTTKLRKD